MALEFRLDCAMQATGLMLGVEFGGGRALANAAKQLLSVEVPKDLQTSDWAAPKLSAGQVAYAATDAILAWRLWPLLTDQLCQVGRWAHMSCNAVRSLRWSAWNCVALV